MYDNDYGSPRYCFLFGHRLYPCLYTNYGSHAPIVLFSFSLV